eukprot:350494-Chlamydomonas_euryale.AAC.10
MPALRSSSADLTVNYYLLCFTNAYPIWAITPCRPQNVSNGRHPPSAILSYATIPVDQLGARPLSAALQLVPPPATICGACFQ